MCAVLYAAEKCPIATSLFDNWVLISAAAVNGIGLSSHSRLDFCLPKIDIKPASSLRGGC